MNVFVQVDPSNNNISYVRLTIEFIQPYSGSRLMTGYMPSYAKLYKIIKLLLYSC